MDRDERYTLAEERWSDRDFREKMKSEIHDLNSGISTGITLVQCLDDTCTMEGCRYCVMSVLTHAFGISTHNAGWYCPFQSNRPIPVKQLAISYCGDKTDMVKVMNFIEDNTDNDGNFTKELEGITDKKTYTAPSEICCNLPPTKMKTIGNPSIEHSNEGDVKVTYILECPTCHKKHRYVENYSYRGSNEVVE